MKVLIDWVDNVVDRLIGKKIIKKIIIILCLILLVVMIIPMLYMSFYNVMCADDFAYAKTTYKMWAEDKSFVSFINIISEAFKLAKRTYMRWGGNYTSAFFSAIQPSAFNSNWTFVNTFLFLGTFLISNFLLVKKVCKKYFEFDGSTMFLIYTVIVTLSVQFLPSAVEAFYWFNGSFYNIMGWSFSLFLLVILWNIRDKENIKIFDVILGVVVSIFVSGTAYSVMIPLFLILVLFSMDLVADKEVSGKAKGVIYALILIYIVTALTSILAPGNQVRQQSASQEGVVKTIYVSIFKGGELISLYFDMKIFLLSLLLTPLLWRGIKSNKNKYKAPVVVMIISFLIFSSAFAPTIRALGMIGVGRTQNIYWWLFVLLYFFNYMYFIGWIKSHMKKDIFLEIEKKKIFYFEVAVFILLLFTLKVQIGEATSFEAYREIYWNEGEQYKEQMNERERIYSNSEIKEVYVQELTIKPALLFFDDITEDENNWKNSALADYYDKKSVVIEK